MKIRILYVSLGSPSCFYHLLTGGEKVTESCKFRNDAPFRNVLTAELYVPGFCGSCRFLLQLMKKTAHSIPERLNLLPFTLEIDLKCRPWSSD